MCVCLVPNIVLFLPDRMSIFSRPTLAWNGTGLLGCPSALRNEDRLISFGSRSENNVCGSFNKAAVSQSMLPLAIRSLHKFIPQASFVPLSPFSRSLISQQVDKPHSCLIRPNYHKTNFCPRRHVIVTHFSPGFDPWAPSVDSQSFASSLFALSLLPYLGFLYHLTKSNSAPGLTLFGFYFLLAFVGATSKQVCNLTSQFHGRCKQSDNHSISMSIYFFCVD